jgi:hypothetical protein
VSGLRGVNASSISRSFVADAVDVVAVVLGRSLTPGAGWRTPRSRMTCYLALTRVVVDNRRGADAHFAAALQENLSGAGFEVEVRQPSPQALYDTTVHFVVEGVSVRVPADISRRELATVAAAVRDAEARRYSERQRSREVAIYQDETSRVLAWVDVFGSDGL